MGLTAILPILILTALGYGVARWGYLQAPALAGLNDFIWKIGIPALLFLSMATSHLPGGPDLILLASYFGTVLTLYALVHFFARRVLKLDRDAAPAAAFTAVYGNGVMLGLGVTQAAFGADGVRYFLVIVTLHSPILLTLSSTLVERARGHAVRHGLWGRFAARLKAQPILPALGLGILWNALGLPLDGVTSDALHLLAGTVVPLGLFAVGASLVGISLEGDVRQATLLATVKLIGMPAAVWCVGYYVTGLDPARLGAAALFAAMPTGIVDFTFARQENVIARRAASVFFLTTVGCAATIPVLLAILR